jgi:hypothetical protein
MQRTTIAAECEVPGKARLLVRALLKSPLLCLFMMAPSVADTVTADAALAQQVTLLTGQGQDEYEHHDLKAAQVTFTHAVELIEARVDASAIELFEPLRGLAQVLFATQQYSAADATLRRAINIVRRDGGLYDPRQLAVLKTLAESQAIAGQVGDAIGSLSYLERISANTFGARTVRHAVMLTEIGRGYCQGRPRDRRQAEVPRSE